MDIRVLAPKIDSIIFIKHVASNMYREANVRILISLTHILLTWRLLWAPNNASKWQIGLNLAFKGLNNCL